jgi:hypothetical protein
VLIHRESKIALVIEKPAVSLNRSLSKIQAESSIWTWKSKNIWKLNNVYVSSQRKEWLPETSLGM